MMIPNRFFFRAVPIALALSCAACSGVPTMDLTASSAPSDVLAGGVVSDVTPQGPGTVFPTIEAAALDALAYCYLESRKVPAAVRADRGGAIRPTSGGYTYDEPSSADESAIGQLRYRLRPGDVAHFRHQPQHGLSGALRSTRLVDREVRDFVDHHDVLSRPVYTLTPSRFVHVYSGAEVGSETLARVERGTQRGDSTLALRSAPERGTEMVTVEQPWIMPSQTDSSTRR